MTRSLIERHGLLLVRVQHDAVALAGASDPVNSIATLAAPAGELDHGGERVTR